MSVRPTTCRHPQVAEARGSSFRLIKWLIIQRVYLFHILNNCASPLCYAKTWLTCRGLNKPNNVICFRFPVQSALPLKEITHESANGSPSIFTATIHINSANTSPFSHTRNYGLNRKEIQPRRHDLGHASQFLRAF